MTQPQRHKPGPLALVGSGEYTTAMETTDSMLLSLLKHATPTRVVVIPTASGLEPGMPQRWNDMGVQHFQALGAEVTPLPLINRSDAQDPQVVAALQGADLYYFSGGNPEYVIQTLRDTPAWDVIYAAHQEGAVLAGCSAGAMLLGSYTISIRSVVGGNTPRWLPALGVAAGLAIMPHFDRFGSFVGPDVFRAILASAPSGITLVGVDEDTALVCAPLNSDTIGWRVTGRQTVSIFEHDGGRTIYKTGSVVPLPRQ